MASLLQKPEKKIGTPAIQIDIDPEALGMNYPLLARVNGDAKVTLTKMLAACDKSMAGKRKAWVGETQSICKEWSGKYKSAPRTFTASEPSPEWLARNLRYPRACDAHECRTEGKIRIEENPMLWTIIVILLVLWLLGLIGNIGGGLIWLLLVIAAIVLLFQLLSGRRTV